MVGDRPSIGVFLEVLVSSEVSMSLISILHCTKMLTQQVGSVWVLLLYELEVANIN